MNENNNKIAIYFLVDPRKPEIVRYVGKSGTPMTRQIQHCMEIGCTRKSEWLELIRRDGILPQIIIKEWVDPEKSCEMEAKYIKENNSEFLTNQQNNPIKINNDLNNKEEKIKEIIIKTNEIIESELSESRLINIGENEKKLIQIALNNVNGNKTKAAKLLGMSRRTLHRRLAEKLDSD